jgi:hypothetical protein
MTHNPKETNIVSESTNEPASSDTATVSALEVARDTPASTHASYNLSSPGNPEGSILEAAVLEAIRLSKEKGGQRRYIWANISPTLKDLGWNMDYTGKSTIEGYVILPPWVDLAAIKVAAWKVDLSILELNRDYFTENDKVIQYIEKYGFHRVDSEVTPEVELGRKRRHQEKDRIGSLSTMTTLSPLPLPRLMTQLCECRKGIARISNIAAMFPTRSPAVLRLILNDRPPVPQLLYLFLLLC